MSVYEMAWRLPSVDGDDDDDKGDKSLVSLYEMAGRSMHCPVT